MSEPSFLLMQMLEIKTLGSTQQKALHDEDFWGWLPISDHLMHI